MEALKKIAAPAASALVLLLILFLCKSAPVSKLWKGYTTLSVPVDTEKGLVENLLDERGCSGCVSLEAQKSEQAGGFFSDYEARKAAYFFDRDKTARIYYVPDKFARQAADAVRLLQSSFHVDAVLGSSASFPYFTPLVCLLAFLALLFCAKNKAVYSAAALPAVFYAFCNPFYAAAAAVCLELYALYLCQRVWRRKGALAFVATNRFALAFMAAAVLLSIGAGFLRSLFFILNLAAALCLVFLLFNYEAQKEKKARFLPVLVLSARMAGNVGVQTIKKSFFVSAEIFLLLVLLFAGTDFLSSGSKRGLFFPAPTEYNKTDKKSFPTIEDYYVNRWNVLSFPYAPLGKKRPAAPQEGERVEMLHYQKEGGAIKSKKELLMVYDADFRKKADGEIDALPYPALEKLWKAQGKKRGAFYSSGGSEDSGAGLAAALLFAALLPLFCALALYFNKRVLVRGKYAA